MSNDSTNKPIVVHFPDRQTAQRVVDIIVRKRPVGWSRKSYATYYREEYAISIKKILDALAENKKPKVLRLDQYPSMSINSLYLFVNQAAHFLRDSMDGEERDADGRVIRTAGHYARQWQSVKVEKHRAHGVTIKYKDFVAENFEAEDFVPASNMPKWKKELDQYLLDSKIVKPFHKDNLMLTPQDMQQLNNELGDLQDAGQIQYVVTSKEIKVLKTTPSV